VNCENILAVWNLFTDVSFSAKHSFLGDSKLRLIRKIYDKIFWGNNLPAITPKNEKYIPVWEKSEINKIKEILLQGYQIFEKVIKNYSQ